MQADDSLLTFPCEFPIKAMGKAEDDFDILVIEIVRQYCPDIYENAVKTRLSHGGRYISVTVTIQAQSRQQLDNIYMALTAHERVIMAI